MRRDVNEVLGLQNAFPIVTYTDQIHTVDMLSEIVAALNELDEHIYFIPRTHPEFIHAPRRTQEAWGEILDKFRGGMLIGNSYMCSTHSIIGVSHVCISQYSITLSEAAAMRVQGISMWYPKIEEHYYKETGLKSFPLSDLGCCEQAYTRNELVQCLRTALSPKGLELETAQKQHFTSDGQNARRIVETLGQILAA